MDKKCIKTIMMTSVGVSLVVLCLVWFALLLNFTGTFDLLKLAVGQRPGTEVLRFVQWASFSLCLLLVPVFTGYVLMVISDNKRVKVLTACVCVLVLLCAIVFMAIVPSFAHNESGTIIEINLALTSAMQSNLTSVIVPMLFVTASTIYAIFNSHNQNGEERGK